MYATGIHLLSVSFLDSTLNIREKGDMCYNKQRAVSWCECRPRNKIIAFHDIMNALKFLRFIVWTCTKTARRHRTALRRVAARRGSSLFYLEKYCADDGRASDRWQQSVQCRPLNTSGDAIRETHLEIESHISKHRKLHITFQIPISRNKAVNFLE